MELSAIGFGIGGAVGMLLVLLSLKIFIPTDIDTRKEKRIRLICCVLLVLFCIVLGGYLFRTEIKMGNYAHKTCSGENCSNQPVCKFYLLGTEYYCIDHMSLAYDSFEPENYDIYHVKDRAGKNWKDAWGAATQIAKRELELSEDAQFCTPSQASIIVNKTGWIVRGHVTASDDAGNPQYIYFRTEFSFTGPDEFYVWSFDYEK